MQPIHAAIDQSIIDRANTKTIDNRSIDKIDGLNSLEVDYNTTKIKKLLEDSTLGEKYIAHAIKQLGLGKVLNIADYCTRKANNPGRAFIGLCQKEIGGKQNG